MVCLYARGHLTALVSAHARGLARTTTKNQDPTRGPAQDQDPTLVSAQDRDPTRVSAQDLDPTLDPIQI